MYKEKQSIFCILVSYNPDFSQLEKTLNSLFTQVDKVVIVKNSPEQFSFADSFPDKIHIIQLEKNMGIAYAQNRGIEYALSHGADFVLFSDQDTVYPHDFVQKSLKCFEHHKGSKIAAVVPLFYNENKKQYARVFVTKTCSIKAELGNEYEVSHAISSGTVCPSNVFSEIGTMNERLFIDFVDFEWCWSATNKGYKIICDTNIVIHHNMGDSFKKVFGRKIVVYSDFRNFFFFRNGTWLLFHSHLFSFSEWFGFAKFMFLKSILYFVTSGFSIKRLCLFCKAVSKGISDKFSLEDCT